MSKRKSAASAAKAVEKQAREKKAVKPAAGKSKGGELDARESKWDWIKS